MPFTSKVQRRKFHVLESQGKIAPATVKEFERATKGKDLPERVRRPTLTS